MQRRPDERDKTHRGMETHTLAVIIALAIMLVWSVSMLLVMRDAALPETARGAVLAVFPTSFSQKQILGSVVRAGGRPVRVSWPQNVWIINGDENGFVGRLYAQGVLAAYGEFPFGPTLAGCFAYLDAQLPKARGQLLRP